MFATFRRFRRHVAVLTALAMLASVLVAVPAVAADPEADFGATFDACGDAPDAGFTDVPSAHANAGDIDCIAYYGITKGTSATTYSPLMGVSREHMALFLTRLAGLVGIEMADDPGDPGFSDTGDLGTESQAAIAQLADLGITQGKSATSYAPADNVTRAQMALFISRTMNLMTPMADGEIGLSSTTQYGNRPSDVNDDDSDVGSPFLDLRRSSKDEHDAITNLYELGVASGISDTAYSPGTDITRAAMAKFMAAALDHSNARPAGLSIQANSNEGWGDQEPTILVSVRDDSFAPMEDQAVDLFSSNSPSNMGLRKDGTCNFSEAADDVFSGGSVTGDCVWDDNDETTDANGNIISGGEVLAGKTRVFYAWIGSKDGDKFDADDADEVLDSVKAKREQDSLKDSTDINEHALNVGYGQQVDLGNDNDVTATAQLKDTNGNDVERAGISIRVEYRQGAIDEGPRDSRSYVNTDEDTLVTGDDGSVEFAVSPPGDSTRVNDQARTDSVVFVELDSDGDDTDRTTEVTIHWIEETPVLSSDSIDAPVYVLADEPSVGTTVRLWDQYGNSIRSHPRQQVAITYTDSETGEDEPTVKSAVRQVISRGYARWATKIEVDENNTVTVTYDVRQLARNSGGSPVRTSDAADETANVIVGSDLDAVYMAWTDLGPSSSSSRQREINALDVTYNDGRVITSDAKNADDDMFTSNAPLYRPHTNDDNDGTTPDVNDDGTDDDNTDNPDPVFVFARASQVTDDLGIPDVTGGALRRILNDDALDTYIDRGELYAFADAMGDVEMMRRDLMAATFRPSTMDHDDGGKAIQVVEKAVSTNVGDDVLTITHVVADDNQFLTDILEVDDTTDTDDIPELVYTYDDDDIFIDSTEDEGQEIDMETFESMIDFHDPADEKDEVNVQVIAYDIDGTSIFRLSD